MSLPTAYEVDVTDRASVSVSHTNGGTASGFELLNNPIELAGETTFTATYDGETSEETATLTGADSVTV